MTPEQSPAFLMYQIKKLKSAIRRHALNHHDEPLLNEWDLWYHADIYTKDDLKKLKEKNNE